LGGGGGGGGAGAVVAVVARLEGGGGGECWGAGPAPPSLDALLFAAVCAEGGPPRLISSLMPLAPTPGAALPPPVLARARGAARLAARAGGCGRATSLAAAVVVHSNAPALVGGGSLSALIHPRGPSAVLGWGRGGRGGGRAA